MKLSPNTPTFTPRRGGFARPVSSVLIAAVLCAALPPRARAKWQNESGSLPGMVSAREVIAAGAVAAVAGGLVIYFLLHHKHIFPPVVNPTTTSFFGLTRGQPVVKTIPITNNMDRDLSITSISLDDVHPPGSLALPDLPSFPRRLVGHEALPIALTVNAYGKGGSARMCIGLSGATAKKSLATARQCGKVSYGAER